MNEIKTTNFSPMRKRQKRMQIAAPLSSYKIEFRDIIIFIVERKMGMTRRTFLMDLARRKGFRVENEFRYENDEKFFVWRVGLKKCLVQV